MANFATIGAILGLSAGISPGPLLALLISEVLQHGIKSGIKVTLAPVITDLPIIVLTLFLSTKLSGFHSVLGVISLVGGLFVFFLGCQSLVTQGAELKIIADVKPNSLAKGIIVNALSPYPYLFWLSVGTPLLNRAMSQNILASLAFVGSFYICLVGSKMVLALLVGRSRSFLQGSIYIYARRFLGLVLCVLAITLFWDGINLIP